MKLAEQLLPPGYRFRELWLPELINGNATLPGSVGGGHGLALTGARKGTTTNGIQLLDAEYLITAANADILFSPPANAGFTVFLRYKPSSITGNRYIIERIDVARQNGWNLHCSGVYLNLQIYIAGVMTRTYSADPHLAAGTQYSLAARYTKETGYHATADGHVELFIDGVETTYTLQAVVSDPGNPGAQVCHIWADRNLADLSMGLGGQVAIYDGVATDAEMLEMHKGIFPAALADGGPLLRLYPTDEGRGIAVVDRGVTGVDAVYTGTNLGWDYGQVRQPVLSFDGVNDRAQSLAGVDISGDLSFIWVGKIKSTYDGLSAQHHLIRIHIDATNFVQLLYHTDDVLRFALSGASVSYAPKPSIDDYMVIIGTSKLAGGVITLFVNGSLVGIDTGATVVSALPAVANIGANQADVNHDASKPLMVGLISGALSKPEAKAVSRNINNHFGLGLSI